jgi:hypothetical protein
MTGRELRDPDGHVILNFHDECWFSMATGNGWYDWTVEEANADTERLED